VIFSGCITKLSGGGARNRFGALFNGTAGSNKSDCLSQANNVETQFARLINLLTEKICLISADDLQITEGRKKIPKFE